MREPPTQGSGARRSLGRRLALFPFQALLFLAITFSVGEAMSRFVLGIQPLTPGTLLFEAHPRRGWHHRAGADARFIKLAVEQPIHINSHGLREREIEPAPRPDVYRILVIGDSAVVGFEVPLEAGLHARRRTPPPEAGSCGRIDPRRIRRPAPPSPGV